MTKQSSIPDEKAIRAGGRTFFWELCLLLIGYLLFYPASQPENSFLLNAAERTYLEAEVEDHGLMDRPYSTVVIYYTRLGGWFSWTKRVALASMPVNTPPVPGQLADVWPITYERKSQTGDSQTRIFVSCPTCTGTTVTIPK